MRYGFRTLKELVEQIEQLRRQHAEIAAAIEKKIDTLVIEVLSEYGGAAGLTEREVCARLQEAGFELPIREAYPMLVRLSVAQVVKRNGVRYCAIRPGVMQRQLQDTKNEEEQ